MKFLVTGSNGYIGKHACEYLRNKKNYIIGTGRKEYSVSEIDQYIQCDFANDEIKAKLKGIFECGLDGIFHIAADNRKEPHGIEVIKSNCIGTQALLELAQEYGVNSFIQLSSVPVIGSPKELPITPKHSLEPPTIYHATKCLQELLADYAYRSAGLRTVSIRIPSPMGIGVNPHYIFPTLIRKAMHGDDIELYGTGSRKQTYVHVLDICKAMENAFYRDNCHGTYVLGSPHLISNKDLAELVVQILDSDSIIKYTGIPDIYDNQCWKIDYQPMVEEIGYHPETSLEEMILEYSEYLKNSGEM
ncbi:NAD-dependent epimerase/dehydratase family protein [Mediterraneibacter agrestimuris]|uniref:NAD-dependent epimerase/dehydratase family protein n=1 Tax=Mediterraneibacter agrestimuris TaxID=2941333 RepID=UPI0020405E48|nr:NAD(P)-dependent oxidoreductase [Mediterraneibacter agrestimuris]